MTKFSMLPASANWRIAIQWTHARAHTETEGIRQRMNYLWWKFSINECETVEFESEEDNGKLRGVRSRYAREAAQWRHIINTQNMLNSSSISMASDDVEEESCLRIVSHPMRTLIHSNAKCQCVPVRAAGVCAPCRPCSWTHILIETRLCDEEKKNVFRRRPEGCNDPMPIHTEMAFYLFELAMDWRVIFEMVREIGRLNASFVPMLHSPFMWD